MLFPRNVVSATQCLRGESFLFVGAVPYLETYPLRLEHWFPYTVAFRIRCLSIS